MYWIKRSSLGQRKSGLIRQVTSLKRFNSYEIFYNRIRKRWPFNTGDCLIEVTRWTGLTVSSYGEGEKFSNHYLPGLIVLVAPGCCSMPHVFRRGETSKSPAFIICWSSRLLNWPSSSRLNSTQYKTFYL